VWIFLGRVSRRMVGCINSIRTGASARMALFGQHLRQGSHEREQSSRRTNCTGHGAQQGRSERQNSRRHQCPFASSCRALSSGNEADIPLAKELTEFLPQDSALIADKAYDSPASREAAATNTVKTSIPARSDCTTPVPFSARALPTPPPDRKFFPKD
jgi:hypothetical protein